MNSKINIKYSKDYEKFLFLDNNRILNPGHVQTMIESVRTMGVIRPVVCIETDAISGKKQRYITDGQHLFTALVAEELEIPYIVLNVEDEIELVVKMAKMNNSSKSWTLLNYVNAFKPYLPDYQKLFKMRNKYNIEPLMLAAICTRGTSAVVSGSRLIKSGHFKITNPDYANIWEGDCKAAVDGAIYANEIREAQEGNRITTVPYDPMMKVHH